MNSAASLEDVGAMNRQIAAIILTSEKGTGIIMVTVKEQIDLMGAGAEIAIEGAEIIQIMLIHIIAHIMHTRHHHKEGPREIIGEECPSGIATQEVAILTILILTIIIITQMHTSHNMGLALCGKIHHHRYNNRGNQQ